MDGADVAHGWCGCCSWMGRIVSWADGDTWILQVAHDNLESMLSLRAEDEIPGLETYTSVTPQGQQDTDGIVLKDVTFHYPSSSSSGGGGGGSIRCRVPKPFRLHVPSLSIAGGTFFGIIGGGDGTVNSAPPHPDIAINIYALTVQAIPTSAIPI